MADKNEPSEEKIPDNPTNAKSKNGEDLSDFLNNLSKMASEEKKNEPDADERSVSEETENVPEPQEAPIPAEEQAKKTEVDFEIGELLDIDDETSDAEMETGTSADVFIKDESTEIEESDDIIETPDEEKTIEVSVQKTSDVIEKAIISNELPATEETADYTKVLEEMGVEPSKTVSEAETEETLQDSVSDIQSETISVEEKIEFGDESSAEKQFDEILSDAGKEEYSQILDKLDSSETEIPETEDVTEDDGEISTISETASYADLAGKLAGEEKLDMEEQSDESLTDEDTQEIPLAIGADEPSTYAELAEEIGSSVSEESVEEYTAIEFGEEISEGEMGDAEDEANKEKNGAVEDFMSISSETQQEIPLEIVEEGVSLMDSVLDNAPEVEAPSKEVELPEVDLGFESEVEDEDSVEAEFIKKVILAELNYSQKNIENYLELIKEASEDTLKTPWLEKSLKLGKPGFNE